MQIFGDTTINHSCGVDALKVKYAVTGAMIPATMLISMIGRNNNLAEFGSSHSLTVTDLCEYAANVDIPVARESIRAVGKIALQQYDVNAIVDRLLQFLEMEKDYVTSEALVLVKDLLRKYPQWSQDCIAVGKKYYLLECSILC